MNSRLIGSLLFLVFSVASPGYGSDLCHEYSTRKEYEKAIDACTAAITSPGSRSDAVYVDRGVAYSGRGRYDEAIADFNTAIKLEPQSVRAYQSRAFAYEGKKEYDKAIADWGKAIELAPAEYAEYNYLNRARLYRNGGHYDKAMADYNSLIQRDPMKASGYMFRAAAYYETGLFREDIQDYRKLIEIYRENHPDEKLDLLYILLLNASGKLSRDEYDEVLKELREYVSSTAPSSYDEKWWRTISKYYLGMDGVSENALLVEARRGKDGKSTRVRLCDAYYSIGEKKLIEGDREAAREFFSKSTEAGISTFSYRYAKAMLRLMQEGKI